MQKKLLIPVNINPPPQLFPYDKILRPLQGGDGKVG